MKKTKWQIFFMLVLALLSLSACGGQGDEAALGAEDVGKEITLAVGEKMQVSLDANPTTGYQWEIASLDEAILAPQGSTYQADSADPNVVGSGGKETFRFEAVSKGEMVLTLIYHQPWEESTEPADIFTITVVVK